MDSDPQASIVSCFSSVAQRFADRLAIRDSTRSLTYSELAAMAAGISTAMGAANVGDGPVAILLNNEARFPAAILGVLAAGHACIPLDATHPMERNARIMAHAGVVALISTTALVDRAGACHAKGLPVLDLDRISAAAASLMGAQAPQPRRCRLRSLHLRLDGRPQGGISESSRCAARCSALCERRSRQGLWMISPSFIRQRSSWGCARCWRES